VESEPDQVTDALRAFADAMTDDFLEILEVVVSERRLDSRTPDLLELAGCVDVPLGKRGTSWDDLRRSVRSERSAPRDPGSG
jgi:hypothetical protein